MKTCLVTTFGGGEIDLLDPCPGVVDLEQIAIGLSRLPRWGGKTRAELPAYNVAQHSLNVASVAPDGLRLPALLHDAHEAILGSDLCSPLRAALECETDFWERLTRGWDAAIAEHFGFDAGLFYSAGVVEADMRVREDERGFLMAAEVDLATVPVHLFPANEFLSRHDFIDAVRGVA